MRSGAKVRRQSGVDHLRLRRVHRAPHSWTRPRPAPDPGGCKSPVIDAREDVGPLYRVMLALGVVAAVILCLGFAVLLRFTPPGERTGIRAHVVGVFPYDAGTGRVTGPPATRFQRDQPFTAQVDWGALPPSMVVRARWSDELDTDVGTVGPATAGSLEGREALVPERTPAGFRANLPGVYTLSVVRYQGAQPVELLATTYVTVLRQP